MRYISNSDVLIIINLPPLSCIPDDAITGLATVGDAVCMNGSAAIVLSPVLNNATNPNLACVI